MQDMVSLIIRKRYNDNPNMSPEELYEAARGEWDIPENRRKELKYAVVSANREIKVVYRIKGWEPADEIKWKFIGEIAEKDILDKFVNRRIPRVYGGARFYKNMEEFIHQINGFASEVEKKHILQALGYIAEKGEKGDHDILYLYKSARPRHLAVVDGENFFGVKDTMRIAYCYAIGEKPTGENEIFTRKQWELLREKFSNNHSNMSAKKLKELGFEVRDFNSTESEKNMTNKTLNLLKQFNQIILYGPPGTGKTYTAKETLAALFGADKWENLQGKRWDIVQFHPSYNYEDFVRGVQVETTEKGQVAYETINKTFGEMCKRAGEDKNPKENKYVLIIDEINRANVSSVLGELIYALEYRGEPVKTPYSVDESQDIIIPENLYIIGTMNTADRTIGQIDYAVRRRFAFMPCPPDRELVEKKSPDAINIYDKVQQLFNSSDDNRYLSKDFDADDIKIGHSYFLPDKKKKDIPHNQQIANKIIRQVIPILEEYVKDGILEEKAKDKIKEIKKLAEKLSGKKPQADKSEENDLSDENKRKGNNFFYWRNADRYGVGGVGRTAFSVIKDFIKQNPDMNYKSLNAAVSVLGRNNVFLRENAPEDTTGKKRYFTTPIEANGKVFYVSNQWGAPDEDARLWDAFKEKMAVEHGYIIGQWHLVNLGEHKGDNPSRTWEDCHKYNFVSGRGKGYPTAIAKFKKGDLVIVRIAESSDENTGYIACAEVVEESLHIAEFRTESGALLADYDVGGGQTYKQKYPSAFDEMEPDYAIKVLWIAVKNRADVITGISTAVQQMRVGKILEKDYKKLRSEFNLPDWHVG